MNEEYETELLQYIIDMQQRFYGLSLTDVRQLVFQFAERNNIDVPFFKVTQLAGKDWMSGFLQRHQTISLRTPEATSLSRATGFNRVEVGKFYNLLKPFLETKKIPPSRIYNMDESGLSTVQKPGKILAKKLRGKLES